MSETEEESATEHESAVSQAFDEHDHDLHMALSYGTREMVLLELAERIDIAAELAEKKRWTARKGHMYADIYSRNAAEAMRVFESCHHHSVFESEVRR